jgi:hypothetical protein
MLNWQYRGTVESRTPRGIPDEAADMVLETSSPSSPCKGYLSRQSGLGATEKPMSKSAHLRVAKGDTTKTSKLGLRRSISTHINCPTNMFGKSPVYGGSDERGCLCLRFLGTSVPGCLP